MDQACYQQMRITPKKYSTTKRREAIQVGKKQTEIGFHSFIYLNLTTPYSDVSPSHFLFPFESNINYSRCKENKDLRQLVAEVREK